MLANLWTRLNSCGLKCQSAISRGESDGRLSAINFFALFCYLLCFVIQMLGLSNSGQVIKSDLHLSIVNKCLNL